MPSALPSDAASLSTLSCSSPSAPEQMVSYRSLNMMDETYLMEIVKDTVAFVSQDLSADLLVAKQKVVAFTAVPPRARACGHGRTPGRNPPPQDLQYPSFNN